MFLEFWVKTMILLARCMIWFVMCRMCSDGVGSTV